MPMMNGMEAPAPVRQLSYFDLDNYDASLFDSLPSWIQDKIRLSPEYQAVA
jgi:hypothetical protein